MPGEQPPTSTLAWVVGFRYLGAALPQHVGSAWRLALGSLAFGQDDHTAGGAEPDAHTNTHVKTRPAANQDEMQTSRPPLTCPSH